MTSVYVSDGEASSASKVSSLDTLYTEFSASTFYSRLSHYLGRPMAFLEEIFRCLPTSPTSKSYVLAICLTL